METTQRPQKVADHAGMARRRRNLAPASNCAHTRAGKGKLGPWKGWLRRERTPGPLNGDRDTMRPWVDDGDTPVARCRSGERGQRELEGERIS
jgi:hypothetical protein